MGDAEVASRPSARHAAFVCLAAAGLAASLLAAPAARAEDAKPPWQPKAPEGLPADFDWIRLPSDEWLKGEIVSMYDGKLEFDSDELVGDLDLNFSWVWDRVQDPSQLEDGSFPEKDDTRLVLGLGWSF